MPTVLLALLLLFAPEKTYKIEYRFRKGDEYLDSTTRLFKMELIQGKSLVSFHIESTETMKRQIQEVKDGRPDIERVTIKDFTREVKKSPVQKEVGAVKNKAIGAIFIWRRVGERWGLFGQRSELTERHPDIVNRLKNWRDARLPKKPVKIGDTWKVSAKDFLEASGQPVPPNTAGDIEFKLAAVDKDGVGKIEFRGMWMYRTQDSKFVVEQTGTWMFDTVRGRDLSLTSTGNLDISGGQEGKGALEMKRVVTWKATK